MATVLVVEDDPDIRALLDFNLRQEGFDTLVTDYGSKALRWLRESEIDLVLLDLMLPDISGLEVCREARREHGKQVPVIMLTARGQEADRLAGLECGADDYVVKPFSMREILLRVRAVLRRGDQAAKEAGAGSDIKRGDIVIDQAAHRVHVKNEEVFLTLTEYELLLMFVRRPGRVFTRQQLLSQVWKMPESIVTRTVDTHVKRLREKLGPSGALIETVRGVGYRFVEFGAPSA